MKKSDLSIPSIHIKDDNSRNGYKIILQQLFNEALADRPDLIKILQDQSLTSFIKKLPFIYIRPSLKPCDDLSCIIVCHYRNNAFKFIYDFLTSLIPEKNSNIALFFAADFKLKDEKDAELFSIGEIRISIDMATDLFNIQNKLNVLQEELYMGISSAFHAQKILSTNDTNFDKKTIYIRDRIKALINYRPKYFDLSLLWAMRNFMVRCPDHFKYITSAKQLTRIIAVQHIFNKKLSEEERSILIKVSRIKNLDPTLAIYCSFRIPHNSEIIGIHQITRLIQSYLHNIYIEKDNYLYSIEENGSICHVYMELKRPEGFSFSIEDINLLRHRLPNSINTLLTDHNHPLLLPNNEEEVMHNIISLSKEIKYSRDIPQVIISFEKQKYSKLSFSIILVRVTEDKSTPLKKLFENKFGATKFIPVRNKITGSIRKKYNKEANVFKLEIPKMKFVRSDNSIDIIRARSYISDAIEKAIGPFRDYNGGLLSKQNEVLWELKKKLHITKKNDEIILENFFYSLSPESAKSLAPIEALEQSFRHLYRHIHSDKKNLNKTTIFEAPKGYYSIAIISTDQNSIQDKIHEQLLENIISKNKKVFFSCINHHHCHYFCLLWNSKNIGSSFVTDITSSLPKA